MNVGSFGRCAFLLGLATGVLVACSGRSLPPEQSFETSARLPLGLHHPKYGVLFSFGNSASRYCLDGAWPDGDLIALNGLLYGTTYAGGTYDNGTVFSISTGGEQQVVYSFEGLGQYGGGPVAGVVGINEDFYGTTPDGGTYAGGTAFKIKTKSPIPIERVLHNFGYEHDGSKLDAALIVVGNVLYGTTNAGGAHGNGAVFNIDRKTGKEKVLYSFTGGYDGGNPGAALIALKDRLYGTTSAGGAYGGGTVFSISKDGKSERVLHSFGNGSDGAAPGAHVIAVNGVLYGTTSAGGAYGKSSNGGTVFSLDLNGSTERVLHSFGQGSDGNEPEAALTYLNGELYGTTAGGGTYHGSLGYGGTIFRVSPVTAKEEVLHSFGNGTDGALPLTALLAVNGTLYGTTLWGGSYFSFCVTSGGQAVGTVYALKP